MVLRVAGGPVRGRRLRGVQGDLFSRTFLKKTNTPELMAGISVVRSGAIWCPQSDGTMRQFASDTPSFEFAGGKNQLRIDQGWTNSFCNKIVGGNLTLGTSGTLGLSGRPLNKATVQSGVFSYAQVGGANSLPFSAASGQTTDISIQGVVGASTGPMSLGMMVVSAITTGPATNANFSGFKISATGVVSGKFLGSGVTELEPPVTTLVLPGVWKFQWLLRYTQDATLRDTARMYLEILDNTGSAVNINGDGVSAISWELCQHTLSGYHPPIVDTTTASATVGASTIGLPTSLLNFSPANGFSYGGTVTVLNRLASQYPSVINFRADALTGSTDSVEVFVPPTANQLYALARVAGVDSYGQNYVSAQQVNKFAMRACASNFGSAFNGVAQPDDMIGPMPAIAYIQIGRNATANFGAMLIDDLWVTPRLLSGSEMASLSV